MRRFLLVLALILVLSLAACGGDSSTEGGGGAAPAGDAAAGETVFNEVAVPACGTCHSLEPDVVLVGPSLAGIDSRAGSRVSGQSAEDYLHESIVDPNAFVVEGFASGLMPQTYGSALSEQQIEDLVAYMMTLK
jgi:sulfur-oxidizing protein SoxX